MLRILAAPRWTLLGMALLVIGVFLSYNNPRAPQWYLIVPLGWLAVNLLCAMASNVKLRRGGLLVFHAALLAIILLVAIGRLTHLDGQVEISESSTFSATEVHITRRGPAHPLQLDKVFFVQGPFTVDYAPGLRREQTRSQILLEDTNGQMAPSVIDDAHPLVRQGYRFSITSNKGFGALLTWLPDQGEAVSGTVNMPSYPFNDWNQENRWTPPGEAEITLRLLLITALDKDRAWTLSSETAQAKLDVETSSRHMVLLPGEAIRLQHGSLRYEGLRAWMGYKVFYDPTLPWLFWVAISGVLGMAWHFWRKFGAGQWTQSMADRI